jgi:hypothetical protein
MLSWRPVRSTILLFLALASCAAPLGEAHPCPESACGDGRSCVAGRCRSQDAPAPPGEALRVVLTPAAIAVVGALGGGGGGEELPETVSIGRSSGGTVVFFFRFEASLRDDAEVESAFLLLDPLDGAPPATTPIRFEMARVVEPWRAEAVSAGRQPRLAVPLDAGSARARPGGPLRVDVTPLVRAWQKRAADDHGLALLARGDDAVGAVVSTGATQGRGPRLEVYVK